MKLSNAIAFNDFYASIAQDNLDIELAYKLNKIIQILTPDFEFYQTELTKIIQDCVETNEQGEFQTSDDGQHYKLKEGKNKEFNERYVKLCDIDINFEPQYKINISLLKNMKISPLELSKIQEFLQ